MPPPQSHSLRRNRHIARSTLTVMIAFAAAKAISLVQTLIIAQVFGVGSELDAYVAANRIPELIVILISGGALTHAFIPVYSGILAKSDSNAAWRLSSNLINVIFSLALIVSAVVFLMTPWLVRNAVAPGFDAQTTQNTVDMMRVLLLSTIIFSVSGIFSGILNSHQHFLLPALAPIVFDVGILFGVLFLMPIYGVHGIAWGAVLGSAMHFSVQVPGLIRYKMRWSLDLGLTNPALWRVIRLMLPRIGGPGCLCAQLPGHEQYRVSLERGLSQRPRLGLALDADSSNLDRNGDGYRHFPDTCGFERNARSGMGKRGAMSGALRFILISSIPSAIGLIVLGYPLISLLERGAFDATASALVYSTLSMFTLGLIVHSTLEVIARSFYADKDTLTPLFAALGGAAINFVLAFVLSDVAAVDARTFLNSTALAFPFLGYSPYIGHVSGLALANSLGVMFEVMCLLYILRGRWHGIHGQGLAKTLLKSLIASLVMAGVIVTVDMLWQAIEPGNSLSLTIVRLAVEGTLGLLTFLITALLLRMNELSDFWNMIRRRASG